MTDYRSGGDHDVPLLERDIPGYDSELAATMILEVKAIAKRSGIKKLVAVNVEGKVFDLENPGDFGRAHIPG